MSGPIRLVAGVVTRLFLLKEASHSLPRRRERRGRHEVMGHRPAEGNGYVVRVRDLHVRFVRDLVEDPLRDLAFVVPLAVRGAEEDDTEFDPGIPHPPPERGLLDHVRREIPELVLLPDRVSVVPHQVADALVRRLEDDLLRPPKVALVRDRREDLRPDERGVLRVVEYVRCEHALVRDRGVPARERVAGHPSPEFPHRRVHRGDRDDVPFRVVHLDPVPEFVHPPRHQDRPADAVHQGLLEDEEQYTEDDRAPEDSDLREVPAEEDVRREPHGPDPGQVAEDLEDREDVRLRRDPVPKARAEQRLQDLQEERRSEEDWEGEEPRLRSVQVHLRGGDARDHDRSREERDEAEDKQERGEPVGDAYARRAGGARHAIAQRGLFYKSGPTPFSQVRTAQIMSANFATRSGWRSLITLSIAWTLSFPIPAVERVAMILSKSSSDRVTSLFFAIQFRYRVSSSSARQPFS